LDKAAKLLVRSDGTCARKKRYWILVGTAKENRNSKLRGTAMQQATYTISIMIEPLEKHFT
jgi:hypothetical protein